MKNFKTILVEYGQSMVDIAMQEYGSVIAVRLIIDDNDLSFDSSLEPGRSLLIRTEPTPNPDDTTNAGFYENSVVQKEFSLKSVRVNTGDLYQETGSGFSSGFSFGFGA